MADSIWRRLSSPCARSVSPWARRASFCARNDTRSAARWLASPWRDTRVNTETKLLQLTYAFDTLGLLRVAFKAHANNQKSLSAIKAIGAIYEGTFRSHYVMPDGSARDSAWFSIIKKEWPEVKEMLTRRLNSPV